MSEKYLTGVVLACLLGAGLLLSGMACVGTVGGECSSDADCAAGQTCWANQCIGDAAEEKCKTDADCGDGQVCQDGQCVAAGPECTADTDCAEGEVCQDGQCVPAGAECTTDTDCPQGQVCQDGQCVVAPAVTDPYEDLLDEQFANNGALHDLAAGGHVQGFGGSCTSCHHTEPDASGKACDLCHSRDEAQGTTPKLKEAMHAGRPGDDAEGFKACGGCHQATTEDGAWDCSQCHQKLDDL